MQPAPRPSDFLVIGGGIVGLSIARELRRRGAAVVLIDKEPELGLHASGRNSGVLHAGFYYAADSLKAKLCKAGNAELTAYCLEKGLPIRRCGKLVVTRTAEDLPALDELARRGQANGVELKTLSAAEAREIEPRAKTVERALFSPTTSSVDPGAVMRSLEADARKEGVDVVRDCAYLGRVPGGARTSQGTFQAGYVVNAAGLYADKVARDYGFSENYRVLPFKGLYLYSDEAPGALKAHVYPVPDLGYPFLGVHFTVAVSGKVKIGPTAIPAFWREQYAGWERFSLSEFAEVAARNAGLFFSAGFGFKKVAISELLKYSRRRLVGLASELCQGVRASDYREWGRAGIRAQLLDVRTRKLEMDFVLEGDRESFHVLNAVSPGFTCALPFARYVCDRLEEERSR
jgi:(S)-2-hydroxyglutarate dehydrogenase